MDVALLNDWIQKFNNICFCYEVQGGLDPNIFFAQFCFLNGALASQSFQTICQGGEGGGYNNGDDGHDDLNQIIKTRLVMKSGWFCWN